MYEVISGALTGAQIAALIALLLARRAIFRAGWHGGQARLLSLMAQHSRRPDLEHVGEVFEASAMQAMNENPHAAYKELQAQIKREGTDAQER